MRGVVLGAAVIAAAGLVFGGGERASWAPVAAAQEAGAKWNASVSRSKLTDDQAVTLSMRSQPYRGKYGETRAMLVIRCQENVTAVYIDWDEYLGDDSHDVYKDWKRARLRIDAEPAEGARLDVSTDGGAAGWWSGREAIPFARRLHKAAKLVVEITPHNESPRVTEFDIANLEDHLPMLAQTCGWKIDGPLRPEPSAGEKLQKLELAVEEKRQNLQKQCREADTPREKRALAGQCGK